MLRGRRVWIEDPVNLRNFYPNIKIVDEIPLSDGIYAITSKNTPLQRLPQSIWVTRNAEFNLESVETIHRVANSFRSIPKKYDWIWSLDIEEVWRFVKEYLFLQTTISFEPELFSSVYDLFKSLSSPDRVIYQNYMNVKADRKIICSSLLTMLYKMQHKEDFIGSVNKYYLKDLHKLGRKIKGVKRKFLEYSLSKQEESDFLMLLFSLKR